MSWRPSDHEGIRYQAAIAVDTGFGAREPVAMNRSVDEQEHDLVRLSVSRSEALLLADGLRSMGYWDYATELDLPRRNGQVFLPEDDGSWWGEVVEGSDEEHAIQQIRILRELAARVESQVDAK